MKHETIIVDQQEQVVTITFNRPEALNALNQRLLTEFSAVLDQIADDNDVHVLLLTGAGDKAFVAGADIRELAQLSPLQAKMFSKKGQQVISRLQALSQPVIAAVNGYALGGGTEMALAADFIYASEKATFGLPEINLGLIPGFGGTQRLARLIGLNRAKEYIFSGKMITAQEALSMGIVNQVFAQTELMSEACKMARTIAEKGKVALRAAKESINRGMDVDLDTGCALEADAFALCMASADAREGTNAFLEKRAARFNSRFDE